MKVKFEYIWLDGYKPEAKLRSKTKIIKVDEKKEYVNLQDCPVWSFDGSSTKQAEGSNSDCVLQPVRLIRDPQRPQGYLVMCEVYNADGTPHPTNSRQTISNNDTDWWFGFEQEYFIYKDGKPYGWTDSMKPQGQYYCGIGNENVAGRKIVEEHLEVCLLAGLDITGINAEVALGQWEYQIFGKGAQNAADDLWLSRFLLYRIAEIHNVEIELHPKPIKGDWNGSGMHCNFSNKEMREKGGKMMLEKICEQLGEKHKLHIDAYGSDNDQRLTGLHETQSINEFSYGISDRGASIRIPVSTTETWKGYLEDRRPASNADPYKITSVILSTLSLESVLEN